MADKLTGPALEDALAARGLPSEGNADDKRAAVAKFDADNETSITEPKPEGAASTTLDDDVTKPSVTAPGDGPADTLDPNERAQSATPNPGPEALAAGTVNAVVPAQLPIKPPRDTSKDRFEEYPATAPDGSVVRVRRNLETGESAIVDA